MCIIKILRGVWIKGIHFTATKSKETRSKILALASTKDLARVMVQLSLNLTFVRVPLTHCMCHLWINLRFPCELHSHNLCARQTRACKLATLTCNNMQIALHTCDRPHTPLKTLIFYHSSLSTFYRAKLCIAIIAIKPLFIA